MIPIYCISRSILFFSLQILALAELGNAANNASKRFKGMVMRLTPALTELTEQHMPESVLQEKSIKVFEPSFAYLVNFFPNPFEETRLLIDTYFDITLNLPPSNLLDPIIGEARKRNDREFLHQLAQYQAHLQAKIDKSNDTESIGLMREFLDEFERVPDSRHMEIQSIFLEYSSLDGCLLDCIKQILLTRRILVDGINFLRPHLPRLFACPKKRRLIFEGTLRMYGILYSYDYLVRMLDQARRTKGDPSKVLLQGHNVIASILRSVGLDSTLPNEIQRRFRTILFTSGKEREYVKWRLAHYNREVRERQWPFEFRFAADLVPLHGLVLMQVLTGIKRFIPAELCTDKAGEPPAVYTDFMKSFFRSTVAEDTSAEIVTKLFENRVDTLVGKAIQREEKYAMFATLSMGDMARMTAASVVPLQEEPDEAFVTFQLEKRSKKQKQKQKKKAKAKKSSPSASSSSKISNPEKKIIVNEAEKQIEKTSAKFSKAEKEAVPEEPEEVALAPDVEVAVERESNWEEKQEESVGSASGMSEEAEEEALREEVEEALRQQQEEIVYYKRLKKEKLDFAKLEKSRVQPTKDDPLIGKPRKVAFLRTEDFRMISEEANQLFLRNTVSEAARAKYGSADRFQWVFDRTVVIDADAYKFLCQVFGLAQGKALLTFENFHDAVCQINRTGKDKRMLTSAVFKFDHVIETADGEVLVPPIGEVHSEHLSSRFNHRQVRKFLMHGGCHPYFFTAL